jgi:hypothetical protein
LPKDAPSPGKPRNLTARRVNRVVEMTLEQIPANATHWSTRTMAQAASISEASARRIWRAHALKPHLIGTFKLSNDPQFVEKLEDVVALHLNPPEYPIVHAPMKRVRFRPWIVPRAVCRFSSAT